MVASLVTRFMRINTPEFVGQDQLLPQAQDASALGSLLIVVESATDHG